MISAGLLLYRRRDGEPEVLLAHPGGPYWARRDEGAWSIPKGEVADGEDAYAAARREFAEELGALPPEDEEPIALGEARQKGGKRVVAWAVRGDFDPAAVVSNTFEMEWPPRSGRRASFPEVDRVAWFDVDTARAKLVAGQVALLDALVGALASPRPGRPSGP